MVEGSVRKAGARVRVTGQLINGNDGGHLWAERFDRDLTDIFAIQDEITHAIVEQLKVKLLPQEKKSIGQAPTDNVEAYTYYLRGRDFLYRHSKRYYELARRMFTKALELDPNYGRAYAGIAVCDGSLFMHYQADLSVEGILEMADKALGAGKRPRHSTHRARRRARLPRAASTKRMIEFEKGVTLDPNSFEAHFLSARPTFMQGKIARAVEFLERAAEINPADYKPPALAIHMYRSLGRESDCKAAARKTVELAERELVSNPEDPRPAVAGALALLELGEKTGRKTGRRELRPSKMKIRSLSTISPAFTVTSGEPEPAFDLLERVIGNKRRMWKDWIENDSDLDGIRNHPRYQKLLEQIG